MAAPEFSGGLHTGIWTSASRRVFEWQRALAWNYKVSSLTFSTIISGPITTLVSPTTEALALSDSIPDTTARANRGTSRSDFASASNPRPILLSPAAPSGAAVFSRPVALEINGYQAGQSLA